MDRTIQRTILEQLRDLETCTSEADLVMNGVFVRQLAAAVSEAGYERELFDAVLPFIRAELSLPEAEPSGEQLRQLADLRDRIIALERTVEP